MSVHVSDILTKAAANKERVTPVDIVMGDHWGELHLGSSLRLSLLRHMLKKQQSGGGGRLGNSNQSRMRIPLEVVRRSPQAMVKVIRNGGTINARGMRDQMAYLEKDGDAPLERSERYFGTELHGEAKEALIEAWGLAGETKTNSDKTTHFVVSFPRDTDHEAAYRAGRAWAEAMFASGSYGDVFDYYTAFHTDRAHPHIHIVVNRRGMENGDWLKVSRRSQFNYDEFRAVQVEVAALEGIIMEASPRLARGVTERPVPDGEIRNAQKEKRQARPPAHTPTTAVRAAATTVLFARQISADAQLLEEHFPELAATMKTVSAVICQGQKITATLTNDKPVLTLEEAKKQSEFIMSRRSEILDGINEIDTEIGTLPNGPERSQFEREASRMKGDAAKLMPDVMDLQDHIDPKENGYYRGIQAKDERDKEFKSIADREVGERAKSIGIDPVKFIARYEGSEPVSKALSDQWRKDELEDIQKNLAYRQPNSTEPYEKLVQTAYDDLHRSALQTYRQAERQLEAHAAKKRELHRIAKLMRDGKHTDQDTDDNFRQKIKETLHTNELRQLEAGKSEAFKHVTPSIDEQRVLCRRYLESEVQQAEGPRKLQLETALSKIATETSRDTDLAAEETRRIARKSRGLER